MTWGNHGLYEIDKYNIGWDIDHIIPLNTAKTSEEVLSLFHYTNLQPLCSKINRDIKKESINAFLSKNLKLL
jgi:5-methylcytosine-specific restriction endonuclease McrA